MMIKNGRGGGGGGGTLYTRFNFNVSVFRREFNVESIDYLLPSAFKTYISTSSVTLTKSRNPDPLQLRLSSPSLNIRHFFEMTQTHFSASIGTRRRAGEHIIMKRQRDFYRSVTTPPSATPSANPTVNNALATTRRGLAQLSVGAQASLRKLRGSCARVANYITSVGSRA
ncbi:hypothetical protein EDD22DRAFT_853728 [Suillus occidentalis]|nr:hypothetical protein EDD22DRAFT_853728 [Suillus occidentalis]